MCIFEWSRVVWCGVRSTIFQSDRVDFFFNNNIDSAAAAATKKGHTE